MLFTPCPSLLSSLFSPTIPPLFPCFLLPLSSFLSLSLCCPCPPPVCPPESFIRDVEECVYKSMCT